MPQTKFLLSLALHPIQRGIGCAQKFVDARVMAKQKRVDKNEAIDTKVRTVGDVARDFVLPMLFQSIGAKMTYEEFFRERQAARYEVGKGRFRGCC